MSKKLFVKNLTEGPVSCLFALLIAPFWIPFSFIRDVAREIKQGIWELANIDNSEPPRDDGSHSNESGFGL